MRGVRRTDNTLLLGMVKCMELAGGHTDIQPIGHPALMCALTCRAEVVQIFLLVFDTLKDPYLSSRVMKVINGGRPVRAELPVGADVALVPGVHHHVGEAQGGRQADRLLGHSKHETQQIY